MHQDPYRIVRRICRIERQAIYNPSRAKARAIARLWSAFSNEIARAAP